MIIYIFGILVLLTIVAPHSPLQTPDIAPILLYVPDIRPYNATVHTLDLSLQKFNRVLPKDHFIGHSTRSQHLEKMPRNEN